MLTRYGETREGLVEEVEQLDEGIWVDAADGDTANVVTNVDTEICVNVVAGGKAVTVAAGATEATEETELFGASKETLAADGVLDVRITAVPLTGVPDGLVTEFGGDAEELLTLLLAGLGAGGVDHLRTR